MTVGAPETDVAGLGKSIDEIQSSFTVNGKNISVTPVEIEDYSSMFGPGMDSGYYVAFDAGISGASTVTVTMQRAAGSTVPSNPATINKDKDTFLFFLGDTLAEAKKANGIEIKGTVNGVEKKETYTLVVNG